MTSPTYPFKLINLSEWAALRAALSQVERTWSGNWLASTSTGPLVCEEAHAAGSQDARDRDRADWYEIAGSGRVLLHAATSASTLRQFAVSLFGAGVNHFDPSSTGPSQLLGEVFESALRDLALCLHAAAGSNPESDVAVGKAPPAPHQWARGYASVLVRWPVAQSAIDLLLDGSLVRSLIARASPAGLRVQTATGALAARTHGLDDQRLLVQGWIGESQIELGVLQSLLPGDVLRLDSSTRDLLHITLSGGRCGVRGSLGSTSGRKALQLVAHDSSLESSQ